MPVLIRITEVFGVDTTVFRAARHPTAGRRPARGAAGPRQAARPDRARDQAARGRRGGHRAATAATGRPTTSWPSWSATATCSRRSAARPGHRLLLPPAELRARAGRGGRGAGGEIGLRRRRDRSRPCSDRLAERHGMQIRCDDADGWAATCTATAPAPAPCTCQRRCARASRRSGWRAQIALLEYADVIDEIVEEEQFEDVQTQILTRVGLANYFAAALILPYGHFLTRPSGCATTSSCSPTTSRWAGKRLPPALHAAAAQGTRRAVLVRPRRPGRQHVQAPVGHRLPVLPLRRHLSTVERLRGVQRARSGGDAGRRDARRPALPVDRPHGHPPPRRLRPARQGRSRSGSAARSATPAGWSTPPGSTCTPPTPPRRSGRAARPASG